MRKLKRLITNIKVAKKILEGTVLICPYCKSIEVEQEYSRLENCENETMQLKRYNATCKRCKATARVYEGWQNNEEFI